jgi:hypothetical protein
LGASLRVGLSLLAFFAVKETCKKELRQWLNPSRSFFYNIILLLPKQYAQTKNGS